jgi:hypothetical protein
MIYKYYYYYLNELNIRKAVVFDRHADKSFGLFEVHSIEQMLS